MQEVVDTVSVDAHGTALRRLVDLVGSVGVASNRGFDVVLHDESASCQRPAPSALRT